MPLFCEIKSFEFEICLRKWWIFSKYWVWHAFCIFANNFLQIQASTWESADFHMPNYVLSKGATPMNQHFEIIMFTSKFCTDFAMQNHFKVRSTQPDTVQPSTNLLHIWLWKNDARQNQRKLLMQTSIFQSMLYSEPYTWRNPALSKTNVQ